MSNGISNVQDIDLFFNEINKVQEDIKFLFEHCYLFLKNDAIIMQQFRIAERNIEYHQQLLSYSRQLISQQVIDEIFKKLISRFYELINLISTDFGFDRNYEYMIDKSKEKLISVETMLNLLK